MTQRPFIIRSRRHTDTVGKVTARRLYIHIHIYTHKQIQISIYATSIPTNFVLWNEGMREIGRGGPVYRDNKYTSGTERTLITGTENYERRSRRHTDVRVQLRGAAHDALKGLRQRMADRLYIFGSSRALSGVGPCVFGASFRICSAALRRFDAAGFNYDIVTREREINGAL